MKLYNALTKKIEEFVPIKIDSVSIYLCGPTVYDLPHLGHGRSAVVFDLLRRYLRYLKYQVKFVSNFTDIDDKMIKRASELGISVKELADRVIPEYQKYYQFLNVEKPDIQPKATEYVGEMVTMIEKMMEMDIAYKLDDGWYFDIKKFKEYGKLKGQNLDDLKAGARIEVKDNKRNPQDFVLWKFKKEGEPSWKSDDLGEGRPGWHIECSAMIRQVFNEEVIDIHGGGEDLVFPHHDCEIAQSKSVFNDDFVHYWVHNAFVMVNNEKMSKSLNNFTTLAELFKVHDPLVVRYFYLQAHYRRPVDFHDLALEQAKNALRKVQIFYFNIETAETIEGKSNENVVKSAEMFLEKFNLALGNDLDSESVLTALYELISAINKYLVTNVLTVDEKEILVEKVLKPFDQVFGVIDRESIYPKNKEEIQLLIDERTKARIAKDYKKADEIRLVLKEKFKIDILDRANGKTDWILME